MAAREAGYYLLLSMRRKTLIPLIFALLLYLAVEVVSLAGLWTLRKTRGITWFPIASRLEPSAVAGLDRFLADPGSAQLVPDPDLGWLLRNSEINAAGMRDDREYTLDPPAGVLRVSAFGDSFTDGTRYRPDNVFIGCMTEDFARTVNVYRGFYTTSYRDFFFSKPRSRS